MYLIRLYLHVPLGGDNDDVIAVLFGFRLHVIRDDFEERVRQRERGEPDRSLAPCDGLAVPLAFMAIPVKKPTVIRAAVTKASGQCTTLSKLRPIAQLPAATILTFVDLGPRLITVTHHNAIAGPYHRNGAAIIDVHHAFGGTADEARTIARKHGATLVLICPNFAESTIYRTRNPKGFYVQLAKGQVPDWLTPVPLPTNSPFMLWRLVQ